MLTPSPQHGDFSLSGASLRASPERARALLVQHGVLILDDDRQNLESVASVCTDFLDIPPRRVVLIHARTGMSLGQIIEETDRAIREVIKTTGASFGGLITDYNLSPSFTSLSVWRAIDSMLNQSPCKEPWMRTGRVLMTGACDETDILSAKSEHLIDLHIHKPFKLTTLEEALLASILKRLG